MVFDQNPDRLGYLKGTGIEVSENLSLLNNFENLVEVTGNPEALDAILNESPAGARILLLGLFYAHGQYTFENIVAYDKMIVGSVGSAAKHFELAIKLLPRIDTKFFTEKILPISEYLQAWEFAKSQKFLKVILEITWGICFWQPDEVVIEYVFIFCQRIQWYRSYNAHRVEDETG